MCAPGSEPSPCRLRNSRRPEGRVSTRRARTACRTGYRTTGPAPPGGVSAQLSQTTRPTVPHPTPPAMTHHHHHHTRPPATRTTQEPRPPTQAPRHHCRQPPAVSNPRTGALETGSLGAGAHTGNPERNSHPTPVPHDTHAQTSTGAGTHAHPRTAPQAPGHRTCKTTHRAGTPVNRSQVAQDTAHAKQHTEWAHR